MHKNCVIDAKTGFQDGIACWKVESIVKRWCAHINQSMRKD